MANVSTWLVFWKEIFVPLVEISMFMTKMFGIPIHSIMAQNRDKTEIL